MVSTTAIYLSVDPDLQRVLANHDVSVRDLLQRAGDEYVITFGDDPANVENRSKEPATIILASAAAVALLTPLLKEVVRGITRSDPIIRERRLLPVEDSSGNVILNTEGQPILHWVAVAKGELGQASPDKLKIKGFGLEISLGDD